MSLRAMSTSKTRGALAALSLAALLAATPALAQMQEPEPDAEAIARTPLDDLNIDRDEIPLVLLTAEQNPYASGGLATCNAIVAEIAAIDRVLGADYDISTGAETGLSEGRIAQSIVGSLIPFRGVVREVSGAAGDQRKLRAAVMGGMVRRGFLKGLGLERGCQYPARPKPAS